jgi:non-canonical (house-cleaning) NTP pyrophosphatase
VWNCLRCLESGICRAISGALFWIGYAGCIMKNKEELKAYRLQLIAEAAEKVRRERELAQVMSEEFNLDEVDDE